MIVKEFLKIVSLLVLIFWVLNNFSFYTSASEIASNIYHYSQATKYESNLLLKSKDKYIYIAKLNKFKKEGNDIQIFNTSRVELKSIITAKKAIYSNNFWILKDVKVVKIPKLDDTIEGKKLNISYHDSMKTLEGFKPSFMDSLYKKAKGLTIWEGFVAINYLKDKGLSIKSIKSNLYKNIFFPLFSLFFSIILFFKLPIQKRGVSLAGVSAKFYFIALFGWGIIFLFEKLSENGIGYPEFLIVLPIMIVGVYSFLNYKKYSY